MTLPVRRALLTIAAPLLPCLSACSGGPDGGDAGTVGEETGDTTRPAVPR